MAPTCTSLLQRNKPIQWNYRHFFWDFKPKSAFKELKLNEGELCIFLFYRKNWRTSAWRNWWRSFGESFGEKEHSTEGCMPEYIYDSGLRFPRFCLRNLFWEVPTSDCCSWLSISIKKIQSLLMRCRTKCLTINKNWLLKQIFQHQPQGSIFNKSVWCM